MVFAVCSDDHVHVFGLAARRDLADKQPACGAGVTPVRPCLDADPACVSCAAASESWASGGALAPGQG